MTATQHRRIDSIPLVNVTTDRPVVLRLFCGSAQATQARGTTPAQPQGGGVPVDLPAGLFAIKNHITTCPGMAAPVMMADYITPPVFCLTASDQL